jgi:alkanesulfonate monooxygenase SsuD/methylene tetrahydromethanopterin reductase-like flavin-dependent oxidoreductase (luciferase family)
VGAGLTCLAVDGWFLTSDDVVGTRERVTTAEAAGVGALIVREGPDCDPLVLAGALASIVSEGLLGVCVGLDEGVGADPGERRHPAVLARDMTTLDLLCNGRSLLCFTPPFGPAHLEAVALCRAMWQAGTAQSAGPLYPVPDALNRPKPAGQDSPALALDLTGGEVDLPLGLAEVVDYLLRPGGDPSVCVMEAT